jgi:hypothetical protein
MYPFLTLYAVHFVSVYRFYKFRTGHLIIAVPEKTLMPEPVQNAGTSQVYGLLRNQSTAIT